MHPWGIKVSIMEPGAFQTGMTELGARERQMKKGWDDLSDELKKEYGKEFWDKGIRTFSALRSFNFFLKWRSFLKVLEGAMKNH